MSIYVFSLLVGYFHSGVDTAQGIRHKYLKQLGQPIKYIFSEIPKNPYLDTYIKSGIPQENMISLHFVPTGNPGLGTKAIEVKEHHAGGRLIAKEFYSDRLLYTEHYTDRLIRTTLRNSNGQIAYEILHHPENRQDYLYPSGELVNKVRFFEDALSQMEFNEDDIILIDRPGQLDYIPALFKKANKAKIVVFLHSGHYYEPGESNDGLYMNPEYYYYYKNSDKIDTFIVSTEEQKQHLIQKLKDYQAFVPNVEAIPICGIDKFHYPVTPRKPYSLLSVSRLNERKKLDYTIRGVVKAHQYLPQISLDIYGVGSDLYTNIIQSLVHELDAEEYIHFKGHMDVSNLYQEYEAYITTSTLETLGLTLIEAVSSGNAIIGLNVRYGSRLFIHPKENGYLTDIILARSSDVSHIEEVTDHIAKNIVELFSDPNRLEEFHKRSYDIAKDFTEEIICKKWIDFFS